jgi:hypothetical protein
MGKVHKRKTKEEKKTNVTKRKERKGKGEKSKGGEL